MINLEIETIAFLQTNVVDNYQRLFDYFFQYNSSVKQWGFLVKRSISYGGSSINWVSSSWSNIRLNPPSLHKLFFLKITYSSFAAVFFVFANFLLFLFFVSCSIAAKPRKIYLEKILRVSINLSQLVTATNKVTSSALLPISRL